jgi:hypothetical protein
VNLTIGTAVLLHVAVGIVVPPSPPTIPIVTPVVYPANLNSCSRFGCSGNPGNNGGKGAVYYDPFGSRVDSSGNVTDLAQLQGLMLVDAYQSLQLALAQFSVQSLNGIWFDVYGWTGCRMINVTASSTSINCSAANSVLRVPLRYDYYCLPKPMSDPTDNQETWGNGQNLPILRISFPCCGVNTAAPALAAGTASKAQLTCSDATALFLPGSGVVPDGWAYIIMGGSTSQLCTLPVVFRINNRLTGPAAALYGAPETITITQQ